MAAKLGLPGHLPHFPSSSRRPATEPGFSPETRLHPILPGPGAAGQQHLAPLGSSHRPEPISMKWTLCRQPEAVPLGSPSVLKDEVSWPGPRAPRGSHAREGMCLRGNVPDPDLPRAHAPWERTQASPLAPTPNGTRVRLSRRDRRLPSRRAVNAPSDDPRAGASVYQGTGCHVPAASSGPRTQGRPVASLPRGGPGYLWARNLDPETHTAAAN